MHNIHVMQRTPPPTAPAMIAVVIWLLSLLLLVGVGPTSFAATVDGAVVGGDGGNTSNGFDAEAESTEVVAGEKVAVALRSRDTASSLLVVLPDDTAALILLCRPA